MEEEDIWSKVEGIVVNVGAILCAITMIILGCFIIKALM